MNLLLGRFFGFLAVIVLAPGILLLALALRCTVGPGILRKETSPEGPLPVGTRLFATPRNPFGDFLRATRLCYLPVLFDIAAGRVRLLMTYRPESGLSLALSEPTGAARP
jgi:hypothetical protein